MLNLTTSTVDEEIVLNSSFEEQMQDLVIFVHGALSSSKSWAYHRRVLKTLLKTKTVKLYNYDIEANPSIKVVDDLVDMVQAELASSEYDRILFIGHSFGGVISIDTVRRLVHNKVQPSSKFKVLAVSSPLGGSGAASFLRIMKPFSQFLKNIGSFDSYMSKFREQRLPCHCRVIVSQTEHAPDFPIQNSDGVVTVESQEHFKSDLLATHSYVTSNHFEVLLHPEVTEEIRVFLQ